MFSFEDIELKPLFVNSKCNSKQVSFAHQCLPGSNLFTGHQPEFTASPATPGSLEYMMKNHGRDVQRHQQTAQPIVNHLSESERRLAREYHAVTILARARYEVKMADIKSREEKLRPKQAIHEALIENMRCGQMEMEWESMRIPKIRKELEKEDGIMKAIEAAVGGV